MCQVRLIEEPDLGGDIGQRLAGQDPIACHLEAPREHVGVGRDPERVAEHSSQLRRRGPELFGRRGDGQGLDEVHVEKGPELLRKVPTLHG